MIKNFSEISQADLNLLKTNGYSIYEKLDMYFFKIRVLKIGAFAFKASPLRAISDIDCITNTMYKDICNYVNTMINPVREELLDQLGELELGMFYLPVHKTHIINYRTLLKNSFYLSTVDTLDDSHQSSDLVALASSIIYGTPTKRAGLISTVLYPNEAEITQLTYSASINKTNTLGSVFPNTYSGLPYSEIEGVIIKIDNSNKQFQIFNKDTHDSDDSKTIKLMYRDSVLRSLSEILEANPEFLVNMEASNKQYIDKIADVFKMFIENTDIFSKYAIDPEDLLPPHSGYMGDLDFDMISNVFIKETCRYNEVYKNIFRLFLHTFSRPQSEVNLLDLPILYKLLIALKYKNYKEILLAAYHS